MARGQGLLDRDEQSGNRVDDCQGMPIAEVFQAADGVREGFASDASADKPGEEGEGANAGNLQATLDKRGKACAEVAGQHNKHLHHGPAHAAFPPCDSGTQSLVLAELHRSRWAVCNEGKVGIEPPLFLKVS